MKISFVIPLYNEEKILPTVVPEIASYMETHFPDDHEIIYVDDGSNDESLNILQKMQNERTRILSYSPNRGKGHAVRRGMLAAEGDIVIFTDCDLAYGLDVVSEMAALFDGMSAHDVIIGSRSSHPRGYEGYGFFRKLASKLYMKILSLYGGCRCSDSQSGIKGFRKGAAQDVFSLAEVDRFAFDFEAILLAIHTGHDIFEMPVCIINHRPSTIHFFKDTVRMLKDVGKIKKRIKRFGKQ